MKLKGGGVIPAQMIWEMIDDGEIKETSRDNIQPASLDLTVTGQIYRMKGTLLPQKEWNLSYQIRRRTSFTK